MVNNGNITFVGNKTVLEYKTNGPYFTRLAPGAYLFEVWGAQGGNIPPCQQNKGGYSRGIIHLRATTTIFVNVGQKGECTTKLGVPTPESYNGGGNGLTSSQESYKACAGGGATDIRISNNSIYHRVIVAGGAGGDGLFNNCNPGGVGGGSNGGNGYSPCQDSITGASQTTFGKGINNDSYGYFGRGGTHTTWDGGGGGGGWFGGGAGQGCISSGAGGSGFILTTSNYNSAKSIDGYALSSRYILSKAETHDGNHSTYGRTGNGKAAITIIYKAEISFGHHHKISFHFFVLVFLIKS